MDDYNSFDKDAGVTSNDLGRDANRDRDRTIAALFSSEDEAKRAKDALKDAGFDHVDLTKKTDAPSADAAAEEHHGFWDGIRNFFGGDDDAHLYHEGVNRGHSLVTVHTNEARVDEAIDILDEYNPVDLDENEESWRKDGWSRDQARTTSQSFAGSALQSDRLASDRLETDRLETDRLETSRLAGEDLARDSGKTEEVIPVVEEQLVVAKRDVNAGNVRVRSYVREIPVSEQVRLREENVSVERRPVDYSTDDNRVADAERAGLFQDRNIEVTATSEEAVIGKNARVTEEVVVRKDVNERTQTVNDTVRKTEVEVDDDRTRADPSIRRD